MPAATVEPEEIEDDSEPSVYQPDLRLDDVNTLHDPATASAAYRKVMSGLLIHLLNMPDGSSAYSNKIQY